MVRARQPLRHGAHAEGQERPVGRAHDEQVLVLVHAHRQPKVLGVEGGRPLAVRDRQRDVVQGHSSMMAGHRRDGDRGVRHPSEGGCAIMPGMAFVPPARHLLRAKDLADARYAEPLDVDDLAAAAGLSRAHFSREFRRAFGESPHAYLLTRRLERAAALLRTTDRSVADICFVGRAAERRLVHDELHADLRRLADRLPRGVPAGRRPRAGPGLRACAPTAARNTARFEKTAARAPD